MRVVFFAGPTLSPGTYFTMMVCSSCGFMAIRSIISADNRVDTSKQTVSFSLKPHKVHIFAKDTEQRIRSELG